MNEVNWGFARLVANRVARVRASNDIADLPAGIPVDEVARRVSAYTGNESPADLPVREILSRRDWIVAALERERLVLASRESAVGRRSRWWERDPIARVLRLCSGYWQGVVMGIKIGGQATSTQAEYFRYPKPVTLAPRFLVIAPNVARKANLMGLDLDDFVSWITIHEVTHILQFAGSPWVEDSLGGMETRQWELEEQPGKSRDEVRALEEQNQLLMEVVEGHAQHVTDVVAAELGSLPNFGMTRWSRRLRLALLATETLNPVLRVLRLPRPEVRVSLGHSEGLKFCNFAAKAGVLDRVFQSPETLPDADELGDPEQWLARTGVVAAQASFQYEA